MMTFVGTSTDGVGVVQMGPGGNGVADGLGNAFKPASGTQGKKD